MYEEVWDYGWIHGLVGHRLFFHHEGHEGLEGLKATAMFTTKNTKSAKGYKTILFIPCFKYSTLKFIRRPIDMPDNFI